MLSTDPGCRWEAQVQQEATRETEIEFTTHRFWRKYMASPEGTHEEVKAGSRQRQNLGLMPFGGP